MPDTDHQNLASRLQELYREGNDQAAQKFLQRLSDNIGDAEARRISIELKNLYREGDVEAAGKFLRQLQHGTEGGFQTKTSWHYFTRSYPTAGEVATSAPGSKGGFISKIAIGTGIGFMTYKATGSLMEAGKATFKALVPYGGVAVKLEEGDTHGAAQEVVTETAGLGGAIAGAGAGTLLCSPSGPVALLCTAGGGILGGLGLGIGTDALLDKHPEWVDDSAFSSFRLKGDFNAVVADMPSMAKMIYDNLPLDRPAPTPEAEALMDLKRRFEETGDHRYYKAFETRVEEFFSTHAQVHVLDHLSKDKPQGKEPSLSGIRIESPAPDRTLPAAVKPL